MRLLFRSLIIPCLCFCFLSGLTLEQGTLESTTSTYEIPSEFQPDDERKAQDLLPQAKGVIWDMLYKTKISFNAETGNYSAVYSDEIKKMAGQTIKIHGFILPLEPEEKFKHFLISKRTPTCSFCPPGQPNEIIEVYADTATEWDEGMVTYEGVFELTQNQELGIFFKMTQAKKVEKQE